MPGCEVDIRKKGKRYVLVVDPIAELKKNWRGMFKSKQTTDEYISQIRGEIECNVIFTRDRGIYRKYFPELKNYEPK